MWFYRRDQQIKDFRSKTHQNARSGHIWLKNKDLDLVIKRLRTVRIKIDTTFFKSFKSAIKSKSVKDSLKLIKIGKKDIPNYQIIWNRLENYIQKSDFENKVFLQTVKTLYHPFYYLNLGMQKRATYQTKSNIGLKKIFLLFGGYRNTIESTLNISFSDQMNRIKVVGHSSKKTHFEGDFEYQVDDFGQLTYSKNHSNASKSYLRNLSTAFARPDHQNYENFSGIKKVYMSPNRFVKKDFIDLEIEFSFDQLESIDDIPLLRLNFILKEQIKDKTDSLQVYGKGYTLLFPWGVVRDFDTTIRFKFKALGFNLFRGRVSEELNYLP
ncbi:hypothetical protein MJH12_10145 [bacterium]|nr:hypothetical protein [bacterium]